MPANNACYTAEEQAGYVKGWNAAEALYAPQITALTAERDTYKAMCLGETYGDLDELRADVLRLVKDHVTITAERDALKARVEELEGRVFGWVSPDTGDVFVENLPAGEYTLKITMERQWPAKEPRA